MEFVNYDNKSSRKNVSNVNESHYDRRRKKLSLKKRQIVAESVKKVWKEYHNPEWETQYSEQYKSLENVYNQLQPLWGEVGDQHYYFEKLLKDKTLPSNPSYDDNLIMDAVKSLKTASQSMKVALDEIGEVLGLIDGGIEYVNDGN